LDHNGKEWLFRHLLHLVDPEIYPDPGMDANVELDALRPGGMLALSNNCAGKAKEPYFPAP